MWRYTQRVFKDGGCELVHTQTFEKERLPILLAVLNEVGYEEDPFQSEPENRIFLQYYENHGLVEITLAKEEE